MSTTKSSRCPCAEAPVLWHYDTVLLHEFNEFTVCLRRWLDHGDLLKRPTGNRAAWHSWSAILQRDGILISRQHQQAFKKIVVRNNKFAFVGHILRPLISATYWQQ
jgi:hypothetical protein